MCQKGVNTDQMKLMLQQANDALALSQQWLEQIHHLADHACLAEVSASVAQAEVLLGESRAKIDFATDQIDGEVGGPEATVELI